MMSCYTSVIVLSWMALGILCVLVWKNSWLPDEDKPLFYITYGIIAASALAEWCGVQISGSNRFPRGLLYAVKCADYILTPMAGGAIVGQMKMRNRWSGVLVAVLAGNAVFQLLACFTGWMIVVDSQNRYSHGVLYPVYMGVYLAVIALTIVQFLVYGKAYRRQNRASLYSIMVLVVVGIALQEGLGGEYRTAYVALTLAAALMFIHYSEFYQMTANEHIQKQHIEIMRDALSGAFSRHAYSKALKEYDEMERLPEDFATVIVDINGLKSVNDLVGHDAGDELIVGAARCIGKVVGDAGKCYRTGGDEFVILGRMTRERADAILAGFEHESKLWVGDAVRELSLSAGYALARDHEGLTASELIKEADQAMYAAKAEYYRNQGKGHDRREMR